MAKSRKKEEVVEEELLDDEEEVIIEEIEYDSWIEGFLDQNRNLLLGIAGVMILAAGGLYYWNYQRQAKSKSAQEVMFKAVQYFEADSLNQALNGDGLYPGFLEIESEYSGTDEANLAKYYIGIIYLEQNNLEEGVTYLEDFDKSNSLLAVSAFTALGYAYEDMGNPQDAAQQFEKAADAVKENEFTTPKMLMEAARNYEVGGNINKARSIYEEIKEEFPNSTEGLNIDKYLGRVAQ